MIERVRKAREQMLSVMELEAEVKALRLSLRGVNEEIREIREEIGRIKEQIASLSPKYEEMNKMVDSLSEEIAKRSQLIDDLSKQLDEYYSKYRDAMIKLKEIKLAKQQGVRIELIEKKRKEIREKLERGEPLTLEELKILYGEF